MDNIKKNTQKKTKKIKPELVIVDDVSPKNITLRNSHIKSRCKKGTQKYKALGPGCYSNEDIDNFKLTKEEKKQEKKGKKEKNKTKKAKKKIELEVIDKSPEIIEKSPEIIEKSPEIIEEIIPILKQKVSKKRRLKIKTPVVLEEVMEEETVDKRYNEKFIDLMEQLSSIMLKQGEPFRARAYQKAQETIMSYPETITDPKQLEGKPGIGSTIMDKLNEYVTTGTLRVLEREKTNPINILGDIYGVGPKKAQELVAAGIKTIDELRVRQDELLNDIQKIGLKYYEQIQERIPRSEIEDFEELFKTVFEKVAAGTPEAKLEIVGSYRRGAQASGDIDVIITGKTGDIYKRFVDELIKTGVILEILSRGQSKTLVIAKLPGNKIARRIDFLYAPPDEFAFAILYFTGSKIFNTVMRQYGLNKGYTFNEHGIYKLENKKKGEKVDKIFTTEKDIFDFLGLQYKTPVERKDGRAVTPYMDVVETISLPVNTPPIMKAHVEQQEQSKKK